MKDKRCELTCRELEELMLNEEFSAAAAEHLQTCSGCREFQHQQRKLRQIVGSLGTVNAPADFDFRLRARLAADSQASTFRYWPFAVKGMATAALLVAFGAGAMVIWQRTHQQTTTVAITPPVLPEPVRHEETNRTASSAAHGRESIPAVAVDTHPSRKPERHAGSKSRRTVTAIDFSSERANVMTNTQPAPDTAAVFPIEASLQPVKVSLDDGRGNARTISFPTVSFGSQRVLATANQFAPKGVW